MTELKQFVEVLEKTQWMPADELAAYQRKPLGKILRHAYETVPFYRFFTSAGQAGFTQGSGLTASES